MTAYLLDYYLEQKQEGSAAASAMDNQRRSQPEDTASAVKTIYVSDIKDSTTEDSITLFFENKKRSGGGDLCDGKEGYKRLSATVARLTFISSKGNRSVTLALLTFASSLILSIVFLIPSHHLVLCLCLPQNTSRYFCLPALVPFPLKFVFLANVTQICALRSKSFRNLLNFITPSHPLSSSRSSSSKRFLPSSLSYLFIIHSHQMSKPSDSCFFFPCDVLGAILFNQNVQSHYQYKISIYMFRCSKCGHESQRKTAQTGGQCVESEYCI
jgi:hypothetical protein